MCVITLTITIITITIITIIIAIIAIIDFHEDFCDAPIISQEDETPQR